jgi:cyanophycinase
VMGEGCRYDLTNHHAFPPEEHTAFCSLPVVSDEAYAQSKTTKQNA